MTDTTKPDALQMLREAGDEISKLIPLPVPYSQALILLTGERKRASREIELLRKDLAFADRRIEMRDKERRERAERDARIRAMLTPFLSYREDDPIDKVLALLDGSAE